MIIKNLNHKNLHGRASSASVDEFFSETAGCFDEAAAAEAEAAAWTKNDHENFEKILWTTVMLKPTSQ